LNGIVIKSHGARRIRFQRAIEVAVLEARNGYRTHRAAAARIARNLKEFDVARIAAPAAICRKSTDQRNSKRWSIPAMNGSGPAPDRAAPYRPVGRDHTDLAEHASRRRWRMRSHRVGYDLICVGTTTPDLVSQSGTLLQDRWVSTVSGVQPGGACNRFVYALSVATSSSGWASPNAHSWSARRR